MRVFNNAEFISCEGENRIFKVLVEEKGRIIFTGDELPDEFAPCESVDLQNRTVIPAFGDSHIHFASFAYFNSGLDCRDAPDFTQLGERIRSYIADNKNEKVILAFGCSAHTVKEKRLPDKDFREATTAISSFTHV